MKRLIEQKLHDWKNSSKRKPLLMFGARQTGKTTTILDFANNNFDNVVYIDFVKQQNYKTAFDASLEPKFIIKNIEALSNQVISEGNTLLFFDEVQNCENALSSLKFFATDMPNLHVVGAGSLLGVHIAKHEHSYPVGYVDMLKMNPMNFEEFCLSQRKGKLFDICKDSFLTKSKCPVHEDLLRLYYEYLIVGGMPEAVKDFTENKDYNQVKKIHRYIGTAYTADMAKYSQTADSIKIIACYDSLPNQLAKENNNTKFMWKLVAPEAKGSRYYTALEWLVASGIVNRCNQVTEGVSPLKSFENKKAFKIYMADTGLLAESYDAIPQDLYSTGPKSAWFRGALAENYVMQQLVFNNILPFYWGINSTHEVDFVIRHEKDGVIPIEVKSGKNTRCTSAKAFQQKYNSKYIIKLSTNNFGLDNGVFSVPLYAASLIREV